MQSKVEFELRFRNVVVVVRNFRRDSHRVTGGRLEDPYIQQCPTVKMHGR